jgi:hypothetical protein
LGFARLADMGGLTLMSDATWGHSPYGGNADFGL